jgi:phospholipid/cholesterol/gamma-HCH transport system ATP-binding protein
MSMQPLIEARGIVNRFGTQLVHDGLDLEVMAGEIFGIVGGSGSGKSVLLNTILGLRKPQEGVVRIQGTDITRLDDAGLRELKTVYGVTFQAGALFSSLTVLQNVQLPMLEHLRLSARALEELALLKVRLVGLPLEAAWKYPAQLSGGMIKRAALARALALDPLLLFLDEPTSGLDPIGAAAFDELLVGLQRELALTVVMITHDLDSIFRTCNRVGVAAIAANPHPWIQAYFHGDRAQRFGVVHGT